MTVCFCETLFVSSFNLISFVAGLCFHGCPLTSIMLSSDGIIIQCFGCYCFLLVFHPFVLFYSLLVCSCSAFVVIAGSFVCFRLPISSFIGIFLFLGDHFWMDLFVAFSRFSCIDFVSLLDQSLCPQSVCSFRRLIVII